MKVYYVLHLLINNRSKLLSTPDAGYDMFINIYYQGLAIWMETIGCRMLCMSAIVLLLKL